MIEHTTAMPFNVRCVALAMWATAAVASFLPTTAFAEQVANLNFSNSEAFDQALSNLMKNEVRAARVSITPPADNRFPPRLRTWIDRLLKEQGEVRWRDDGGRGAVAVVLGVVLSFLAEKAFEYVTEQMSDPVKNYHVVISLRMSGKITQVLALEFYRRDSAAWIEAVATSNAMK